MHEKNCTFYVTVQNGYKKIGKKRSKMLSGFLFSNLFLPTLIITQCSSTEEKKGKGLGSYIDKLCVDPTAGIKYLVWAVKIY